MKLISTLLCVIMLFASAGCAGNTATETTQAPAEQSNIEDTTIIQGEKVMVTITMENGNTMDLELYPEIAPKTVENFVKLANDGFYNGLTFHRIIHGFMIQGGDPEGTGYGGSKETIKGEFTANGVANTLSHKRGVISMARSQDMNSASSQFFICHEDALYLDGQYAAFGRVINGFETLDELAATPVSADGQTPIEKPVIKSITVK